MSNIERVCHGWQRFACPYGTLCQNHHVGPGAATPEAPGPDVGRLWHQHAMNKKVCKNYTVFGVCSHEGTGNNRCRLLHIDRDQFMQDGGAAAIQAVQQTTDRIHRAAPATNAAAVVANFSSRPPPAQQVWDHNDAEDSADAAAYNNYNSNTTNSGMAVKKPPAICHNWVSVNGCTWGALCELVHDAPHGKFAESAPTALAVRAFDPERMCKGFLVTGTCSLEMKAGKRCVLSHFSVKDLEALSRLLDEADMGVRLRTFLARNIHRGSTLVELACDPHVQGLMCAMVREDARRFAEEDEQKKKAAAGEQDQDDNSNKITRLETLWLTLIGDEKERKTLALSRSGDSAGASVTLTAEEELTIITNLSTLLQDDIGTFFLLELVSVLPSKGGGIRRPLIRAALRLLNQRIAIALSVGRRCAHSNPASRFVRYVLEFVHHDFLGEAIAALATNELMQTSNGMIVVGDFLEHASSGNPARDAVLGVVFANAVHIIDHSSGNHVVTDMLRVAHKEEKESGGSGRFSFVLRALWLQLEQRDTWHEIAMHKYGAVPMLSIAERAPADVLARIVAGFAALGEARRVELLSDMRSLLFLEAVLANAALAKGECSALVTAIRPALRQMQSSRRADAFQERMVAAMERTGAAGGTGGGAAAAASESTTNAGPRNLTAASSHSYLLPPHKDGVEQRLGDYDESADAETVATVVPTYTCDVPAGFKPSEIGGGAGSAAAAGSRSDAAASARDAAISKVVGNPVGNSAVALPPRTTVGPHLPPRGHQQQHHQQHHQQQRSSSGFAPQQQHQQGHKAPSTHSFSTGAAPFVPGGGNRNVQQQQQQQSSSSGFKFSENATPFVVPGSSNSGPSTSAGSGMSTSSGGGGGGLTALVVPPPVQSSTDPWRVSDSAGGGGQQQWWASGGQLFPSANAGEQSAKSLAQQIDDEEFQPILDED